MIINPTPPLSKEEEQELLGKIASGIDIEESQTSLLRSNIRFVYKIAYGYYIRNLSFELDELAEAGCIGLFKAIQRYDINKFDVKVNTYAEDWIKQSIQRYIDKCESSGDISLDDEINEDGDTMLMFIPSLDMTPEEMATRKSVDDRAAKVLDCLNDTEKSIVKCVFWEGKNCAETARHISKSPERVRQIFEKAKRKMRFYALKNGIVKISINNGIYASVK